MLLAAIYCCNSADAKKYVGTSLDPSTDSARIDTPEYNSEYLLYSTVKVNGVLPLKSTLADFVKVVGKPDSIIKFNAETDCQFYEEPYQYLYFQESMFFLVKDTAIFRIIDFRKPPDLELGAPSITLNAKTTLSDVQKIFPKAVGKIRTIDNAEGGHLRLVDLGASKEIEDEWWIFCFDGDKLVSVEMYGPC